MPATLSRDFGVLPIVPVSRIAPLDMLPLTCLPSPMVVRRLFFMTGAVRGLRTLVWNEGSFSLLTILRAWLAVKRLFSFGGEPAIVAAVGLLARLLVVESWPFDARDTDPDLFNAILILTLSERSACQLFSPSSEELLPLSFGVLSFATACMICKEDRFPALLASRVRRGDWSVSEEERLVMVGGGGEPSDFFERKPAWNRFTLGLISIDGSGAVGIGDEPRESLETSPAR